MYSSYGELDNASKALERDLQSIVNVASEKVRQQLSALVKTNLMSIKNEVLGSFKVIAYKTFQETFYEAYGHHYDVNALNNSITFSIDDNLRPYLSYNILDFTPSNAYEKDRRAFNQNAEVHGRYDALMDWDEIEAVDEADYFGMNIENDNPYDDSQNELTTEELANRKIFKENHFARQPKDVYKEAEIKAYEEFFVEYNRRIKPRIKARYGIAL